MIFLGNETYTGGTTIAAGTLQVGNGGASGSYVGNTTINSGGALAFNRNSALTIAGDINNSGTIVQNGSSAVTLAGNISGSGTLVLNGVNGNGPTGGSMVVSGADTRTGQTIINGGTLTIDVNGSINGSSNLSLGGALVVNNAGNSSSFGATTIPYASASVSANFSDSSKSLALAGITRAAGGVVNFNLPTTGSVTTPISRADSRRFSAAMRR